MRILAHYVAACAATLLFADVVHCLHSLTSFEHALQLIHPRLLSAAALTSNGESSMSVDVDRTVIDNRDVITLNITNTGWRDSQQWVGAYSPASADVNDVVPVKYAFLAQDPSYLSTGRARLRFQMINMRADVVFRVFDCPLRFPRCSANATSTVVSFRDPGAPLKARVLPTATEGNFMLMWSSGRDHTFWPWARWGFKRGGPYPYSAQATTRVIERAEMCEAPATSYGYRDLGYIHEVLLTALPADSVVFYVFGDDQAQSAEHQLRTPPAVGPDTTFSFFAFGDLGRGSLDDSFTWHEYGRPSVNTTRFMTREVARGSASAVVHFGDLSYAMGYAAVWDEFLDMLEPVASAVPYMVVSGNHEADAPNDTFPANRTPTFFTGHDSGGECNVPTVRLFHTPRVSEDEDWWSWNAGPVHLVGINTEHDLRNGSAQWRWLDADLASVDRAVTPWVVLVGHRPMYISSNFTEGPRSDAAVAALFVTHLEPLLLRHRVDLAFWGHNHAVQRFCASAQGRCRQRAVLPAGCSDPRPPADAAYVQDPPEVSASCSGTYVDPAWPVHVVAGTGGASFTVNAQLPVPDAVDGPIFYRYGAARVTVVGRLRLSYEWIEAETGRVLDRFSISRPRGGGDDEDGSRTWLIVALACGVLLLLLAAAVMRTRSCRRRAAEGRDELLRNAELAQAAPSGLYSPVHEQVVREEMI